MIASELHRQVPTIQTLQMTVVFENLVKKPPDSSASQSRFGKHRFIRAAKLSFLIDAIVPPRFAENFSECDAAVAQRPGGDTTIQSPQPDGQVRLFEELMSDEPSI